MYFSQYGQDSFIDKTLFKKKKNGFFVEVGADDGVTLSNTIFFEKERGWSGICIEPRSSAFKQLVKNRTCICENAAISNESKNVPFFEISGGEGALLSGLKEKYDSRHLARVEKEMKERGENARVVTVKTVRLDNIFKKHRIEKIDYLSIDIEGGELEVLKSIDLKRYQIDVISVENNYDDFSIRDYLEGKGYVYRARLEIDEIYTRIGFDNAQPVKKMNDIITVITPSYNQGRYLRETIESVLSQEGDFFIDYIIADGGSNDGSVDTIRHYEKLLVEKKYPLRCKGIELRWWSKKDGGQANAINEALQKARGDIVTWLNSDDYYLLGALQFAYTKFRQYPDVDLIYGDSYFLEDTTGIKTYKSTFQGNYYRLLEWNCVDQASSFFTKRIVGRIGLIDTTMQHSFDRDYWIRIAKVSQIRYFGGQPLSVFRLWPGSKTCAEKDMFKADDEIISKKYGKILFTQVGIKRFSMSAPMNLVKRAFPIPYRWCKQIFYYLRDRIRV